MIAFRVTPRGPHAIPTHEKSTGRACAPASRALPNVLRPPSCASSRPRQARRGPPSGFYRVASHASRIASGPTGTGPNVVSIRRPVKRVDSWVRSTTGRSSGRSSQSRARLSRRSTARTRPPSGLKRVSDREPAILHQRRERLTGPCVPDAYAPVLSPHEIRDPSALKAASVTGPPAGKGGKRGPAGRGVPDAKGGLLTRGQEPSAVSAEPQRPDQGARLLDQRGDHFAGLDVPKSAPTVPARGEDEPAVGANQEGSGERPPRGTCGPPVRHVPGPNYASVAHGNHPPAVVPEPDAEIGLGRRRRGTEAVPHERDGRPPRHIEESERVVGSDHEPSTVGTERGGAQGAERG